MLHRFLATVPGAAEPRRVIVERLDGNRFRVTIDGRAREVDALRVGPATWSLLGPDGAQRLVDVEGAAPELTVSLGGASLPVKIVDARLAASMATVAQQKTGPQAVRAPMPGKVVKVLVKIGDAVKSGQGVAIVEAMKMENELRAPRDGTVVEVSAREGQAVDAGQTLATVE